MKKDSVKKFIESNQPTVPDNDFTKKIIAQLDYYPQPVQVSKKKALGITLLIPCCFLAAVLLIAFFGGWKTIADLIVATEPAFRGLTIISMGVCFCLLAAITWITITLRESYLHPTK